MVHNKLSSPSQGCVKPRRSLKANLMRNWALYTMMIPGFVLVLLFSYVPMYGISMAFQRFKPTLGFFHSPWADPWYRYFKQVITDPYFIRVLKNTLVLGIYYLLWSFPAPVLLALLFNEIRGGKFKRVAQTISYMPYFLSTVIIVGLMKILFASAGPVSMVLDAFGIQWSNPFLSAGSFRTLYIGSGIWMTIGYNSIIYLAAISGVNPELYEAATIDGATRIQQIRHITLPSILPTVTIMLILAVAGIAGNDYNKIILMYNEATYETADVIGTYTFRVGIQEGTSQSYAAAAGLFTAVLSFLLLTLTNCFSRRVGETSLW